MAKTIMISNKLYDDLKKAKGNDKSFSEVITEALEKPCAERKTIAGVLNFAGALKGDTEYDDVMKWSRERWRKWRTKQL